MTLPEENTAVQVNKLKVERVPNEQTEVTGENFSYSVPLPENVEGEVIFKRKVNWDAVKLEIESSKMTIYAQWLSVSSGIMMLILALLTEFIIPISSTFAVAIFILSIEIPAFYELLPIIPTLVPTVKFNESSVVRGSVCICSGALMFLSMFEYSVPTFLLLPASTLVLSSFFYFGAALFKQERVNSIILGGKGLNRRRLPS